MIHVPSLLKDIRSFRLHNHPGRMTRDILTSKAHVLSSQSAVTVPALPTAAGPLLSVHVCTRGVTLGMASCLDGIRSGSVGLWYFHIVSILCIALLGEKDGIGRVLFGILF